MLAAGRDVLDEFDGKNWSVWNAGFDRTRSMIKSRDGTIWVASASGIHRYTNGSWLSNGEDVCIEKRGEPVAMLTALRRKARKALKKPDFAARRKAIWGGRVFSDAEVKAMREAELEGEEG